MTMISQTNRHAVNREAAAQAYAEETRFFEMANRQAMRKHAVYTTPKPKPRKRHLRPFFAAMIMVGVLLAFMALYAWLGLIAGSRFA